MLAPSERQRLKIDSRIRCARRLVLVHAAGDLTAVPGGVYDLEGAGSGLSLLDKLSELLDCPLVALQSLAQSRRRVGHLRRTRRATPVLVLATEAPFVIITIGCADTIRSSYPAMSRFDRWFV